MPESLVDVDPGPRCPDIVRMVVEIPKKSANKYEYDKELLVFRLDRPLYSPMHYPGDYGFIPGTLSEDGDPLDVLTLVEEPTFSGCLLEIRPIGLLRMIDQGEPDRKIMAVCDRDPVFAEVSDIEQIFPHVRDEIAHFFAMYKDLEGKKTEVKGWSGPKEARRDISDSRARYLAARALATRTAARR
jgi:inorganic pyrophosphatase